SFASRADFEINFRSPKKYTLVATGNKVSETTDGDWLITSWKSDPPLAVAGFAFGDYKVYNEKAGTVDIDIYANRQPDDFMHSIEQVTEGSLPGESTFGMPAMGSLSPSVMAKTIDRKSTRLNSSHLVNSYAVFCLKKKKANSGSIQADVLALDNNTVRMDDARINSAFQGSNVPTTD